jgi:hypothetical protein
MWWHTRRNQILSSGETDESIQIGGVVSSVDYWQPRFAHHGSNGSNAWYTMFRGSLESAGYPLHSPVSPLLPLPCVTVCHPISNGHFVWEPRPFFCPSETFCERLTRAPDFYAAWCRRSLQTLLSGYEFCETIGSVTVMLILPKLCILLAPFRWNSEQ